MEAASHTPTLAQRNARAAAIGRQKVKDAIAAGKKPKDLQSKVTNGRRVFAIGGDGRGAWTRRWKDLHGAHVADLGGLDGLSEAQVSLCRRCAAIEVQLEQIEASMSIGAAEMADLDLYNRLTGNLRRLFETIGLRRQARDVTPTLASYVAQRGAQTVDADAARDEYAEAWLARLGEDAPGGAPPP